MTMVGYTTGLRVPTKTPGDARQERVPCRKAPVTAFRPPGACYHVPANCHLPVSYYFTPICPAPPSAVDSAT